MRFIAAVVLAFAGLVSSVASASVEGLFWDPAFPGEGWALESENDVFALTWYRYDDAGQPTFRVGSGPITYTNVANALPGSSDALVYTITGRLYRATATSETDVGGFTVTFTPDAQGRLIGQMNAAGTVRRLERFHFALNEDGPIDQWHGAWVLSGLGTSTVSDFAVYMELDVASQEFDEGVGRTFVTADGAEGVVVFDDVDRTTYISFEGGTANQFVSGYILHDDDSGIGEAQLVNGSGQALSTSFYLTAVSLANTEGEFDAFEDAFAARKSARAPTDAATRKTLQGLIDSARALRASRAERQPAMPTGNGPRLR